MEALRHIAEGELYHRSSHSPWAERERNPVTLFTARLVNDTGGLQVETRSCLAGTLREQLSTTQPKMDDETTMEVRAAARDHVLRSTSLELIILPRIGERRRDRIGLDRDSLLEMYKYLDLDPWLLSQLCRVSSSWTCCTFAEGILNFQLLTSMNYIAWSVNTSQGATKTKAILMAQEHICYSRWFYADAMLEAILKASVVSLEDPFGLANLVLLDVISGHGVFGYGYHEKISSLDTQHLAFAAREMGICIGMVSYCIRLAELAEQMVLDLRDEVEKSRRVTQDGRHISCQENPCKDHSSFMQSLDSSTKKVWNFKVEAKDLDNRVRAQSCSEQIFALISNRHAEASRRDSGSMKTIAVMTMVFLPGTFLAALFAVPSLDWSGPKFITSNFWVYWAFTIPSTLVVLLAWTILSLDRPITRLAGKEKASHKMLGTD